jgi:ADP-ribose pyrophosphatase
MEIKQAKKLTDSKWLNLFEVRYVDRNGKDKNWQLATRAAEPKCVSGRFEQPDAVIIVALHGSEGKLVITREYRVALGGYEYGFPAGLVDPGETPKAAAGRELMEETGLTLTRVLRTSPAVYPSAGLTDESVAMVYVECDGEPTTRNTSDSEVIDVMLLSREEASQLCRRKDLKFDAKAWLVISRFADDGRI